MDFRSFQFHSTQMCFKIHLKYRTQEEWRIGVLVRPCTIHIWHRQMKKARAVRNKLKTHSFVHTMQVIQHKWGKQNPYTNQLMLMGKSQICLMYQPYAVLTLSTVQAQTYSSILWFLAQNKDNDSNQTQGFQNVSEWPHRLRGRSVSMVYYNCSVTVLNSISWHTKYFNIANREKFWTERLTHTNTYIFIMFSTERTWTKEEWHHLRKRGS